MFSLESPQRGDFTEYTQYTIPQCKKKKIILNYSKSASIGFVQEGIRNSRGKRAISVRAIEVLLYNEDYIFLSFGIIEFIYVI